MQFISLMSMTSQFYVSNTNVQLYKIFTYNKYIYIKMYTGSWV